LAFLKKESVDLVITDINMPLLSGLELAEVLDSNQKFIFTTAFAEHALSSFSYYVIDYLLKPISLKRFIQAIKKSETLFSKPSDHDRTEQQENVVFAKSGKQIVKIDFKEVRYVKGEKEYVSFHFEKERLLVYKRMKEIELLLPDYFKRIHASYIININYIRKIDTNHVFIGDINIPITGSYREAFNEFLHNRMI